MRKSTRRILVVGSISVLVLVAIGLSLRPRPTPADFAEVARGAVRVTVDEEGKTRLKDVYVVSAPVVGRVLRIDIDVGDVIRAGETILATFEPSDPEILNVRGRSEAESEVRAAEAAIELAVAERVRSNAELEFAKSELARNEPLVTRGTISKAEYDRARLEVDRARARLAEARANVDVKRSQLEMARAALITVRSLEQGSDTPGGDERFVIPVRAPIDGRVMRIMQESEAVVTAGTPILEVGDQSELEIVVDLLSSDAVRVSEGDAVIIEEWGGAQNLAGVVRRVEPFGFTKISALGIEEQRVNVIIDLASPHEQWGSLGHGYRVETRIIIEEHEGVLKIPVSALFRTGERWSVFVDRDGVARLQIIDLGGRNALEAEVTSGLSEGERVILHPSDQIADGVRVEARPRT